MTTLNISLPESMRAYVEEQAQLGGYSTTSEYVRALIREDQRRKAQEQLEGLLLEGLQSGTPQMMTPEDWKAVRAEVQKRIKSRRRAR